MLISVFAFYAEAQSIQPRKKEVSGMMKKRPDSAVQNLRIQAPVVHDSVGKGVVASESLYIPNALADKQYLGNVAPVSMPVGRLSGAGIVVMPGTKRLEKDKKIQRPAPQLDSVYIERK